MSKIRVVHLTSVHSWKDPRIFLKQCVSLSKCGYEVYLIAKDGTNKIENDVHVLSLNSNINSRLKRVLSSYFNAFRKIIRINPTIIHFHDPELIPLGIIFRILRYKIIYDVHEDYITAIKERKSINKKWKKILGSLVLFWESLARKFFKIIIAESYYIARFPRSVEILNYPILHTKKDSSNEKQISKSILYTGNITEDRGALNHVQILNHVESIELTMVGYVDSSLANQIRKIVGSNINRLTLVGENRQVPFSEIEDIYMSRNWLAGLAIFPYTKHYENKILTKFYEYLFYGIPVIYSDFPVWKKFWSQNLLGFSVNPNEPTEVSDALDLLLSNKEIWNNQYRMSKITSKQYSWSTQEEKLTNLYKSILR